MNKEIRVAQETNREKIKAKYNNKKGIDKIIDTLTNTLAKVSKNTSIILVCIGTDRSTGDSLGPLVGTLLQKSKLLNKNKNLFLYGTLHNPVHAENLSETLDKISKYHSGSFVIAIDACLGKLENVDNINFDTEPIKPGAGVGKDLPYVGNCHVTATVNVGGYMEYMVLQNTRLSLVYKQAECIKNIIRKAYIQSLKLRTDEVTIEKVSVINGLRKKKREVKLQEDKSKKCVVI